MKRPYYNVTVYFPDQNEEECSFSESLCAESPDEAVDQILRSWNDLDPEIGQPWSSILVSCFHNQASEYWKYEPYPDNFFGYRRAQLVHTKIDDGRNDEKEPQWKSIQERLWEVELVNFQDRDHVSAFVKSDNPYHAVMETDKNFAEMIEWEEITVKCKNKNPILMYRKDDDGNPYIYHHFWNSDMFNYEDEWKIKIRMKDVFDTNANMKKVTKKVNSYYTIKGNSLKKVMKKVVKRIKKNDLMDRWSNIIIFDSDMHIGFRYDSDSDGFSKGKFDWFWDAKQGIWSRASDAKNNGAEGISLSDLGSITERLTEHERIDPTYELYAINGTGAAATTYMPLYVPVMTEHLKEYLERIGSCAGLGKLGGPVLALCRMNDQHWNIGSGWWPSLFSAVEASRYLHLDRETRKRYYIEDTYSNDYLEVLKDAISIDLDSEVWGPHFKNQGSA